MNVADLTDDELRQELFRRVVRRLEKEASKDSALVVEDGRPVLFSIGRHGRLLVLQQGQGPRLLGGELRWEYEPDLVDPPWTFTVLRAADRSLLRMTPAGPSGTLDDVVDNLARTFLTQTEAASRRWR